MNYSDCQQQKFRLSKPAGHANGEKYVENVE